jgi:hypothetical protein
MIRSTDVLLKNRMKLYVQNLKLSRNVLNAIFPHEDIYYLLVLLVEQELLTFTEHMSSPPVFSGVHVTRSLVLCVYFVDRCLLLVLSVLHRFTILDTPCGIFKLFLVSWKSYKNK